MSLALSGDGAIIGTLPYMAPEQLEGKPVDARTDLFALGAVLYEMTTGQAPFQGSSKASVIVAILSEEPVPLSTRQPLTPPLLEHAIQRCLAKEPDARWQTAADLGAELTYILDMSHGHAWNAGPARRWSSRQARPRRQERLERQGRLERGRREGRSRPRWWPRPAGRRRPDGTDGSRWSRVTGSRPEG